VDRFKKYLLFIISGIGTLLGILLAAKAMNKRKINPKIAKNDAEVKRLESQIQDVKAEKQKLNNKLTDLTKTADGRSKQVKEAKKNVKKNDQTIADLEAALAEAEKNL
tara:strand:+ start:173 stop:496 length:324 start_codon:yes stop_codon:yes gene_type:complete